MSDLSKEERKALKTPDAFVRSGRGLMGMLAEARNRWVPILIVGLVAVGAVYGYDWWEARQLQRSWKAYFVANEKEGDEKWAALEKVYQDESGLRAGFLAAVALADHHFETSRKAILDNSKEKPNVAAAVDWYGKALAFGGLQPLEKQLLHINRAQSHELQQAYDNAIADLESAQNLKDGATGLAVFHLGRVWELKGDVAKAESFYQRVISEFKDTAYAASAANYLRALKSPHFRLKAPKKG